MVRYSWSTNPIVLRDLARRREDALGADLRAPVAEIARRAREAMLANPGFARWRVPRYARTHRSLGATVRIRLPPAVSHVRTTGSGATFGIGCVARREHWSVNQHRTGTPLQRSIYHK